MLAPTCITVPGLNGSGPDHWQTWAEKEIPNCRRVSGIDFDKPVIAAWADAIRNNIRDQAGSVILIAHSFGSLASVVAIADNETKVAGVVLVAPASPQRFSATGLIGLEHGVSTTLLSAIPVIPLGVPGMLIASSDDPWMKMTHARYWAENWGLRFSCLRNAGHINMESGFGPWPALPNIVCKFREQLQAIPLGQIQAQSQSSKNRFTALSKIRLLTRNSIDLL
ncbi:RBBP9/YdeN family alpha/beta hydrolase [Limnobacter alexandrii]|uniref:RBBP9/YdeN family alpha/beta hydrolase n=1 Tax=Limnobacter alexandrii TaxID=2570352 RepID=UPI00148668D9|nr:alpha/beta hydrolase [Limnobacter alexandrii]